jgi:hypothetical protein
MVNTNKSNIVHFRKKRKPRSQYIFKLGTAAIEYVNQYKYLGLYLDEHLDYKYATNALSAAGSRALGALIDRYKRNPHMGYKTYYKLYNSYVTSITDYASCIWGFKKCDAFDVLQHKAQRVFLGVNRFSPNSFLDGDCNWLSPSFRRYVAILRYYNRLKKMHDERITKQVFAWDLQFQANTWSKDVLSILNMTDQMHIFANDDLCDIDTIKQYFIVDMKRKWVENVRNKPKLRLYRQIQTDMREERYLRLNLSRKERSHIAQLRAGILQLSVETGRYRNISLHERICVGPDCNDVETEIHFLFTCPLYTTLRQQYISQFIRNVDYVSALKYLCELQPRQLAKYIVKAMTLRQSIIFH